MSIGFFGINVTDGIRANMGELVWGYVDDLAILRVEVAEFMSQYTRLECSHIGKASKGL